jgi:hypothetical protein
MGRRALTAAVAIGGTAAYVRLVKPRLLRWGATTQEAEAPLPGDDLIPRGDLAATRAITVHAAPDQVWPWIAQLGQGRGGFYSYDVLENLVGCNIHAPIASSASGTISVWGTRSSLPRRLGSMLRG